jgi:hypothetical protein
MRSGRSGGPADRIRPDFAFNNRKNSIGIRQQELTVKDDQVDPPIDLASRLARYQKRKLYIIME